MLTTALNSILMNAGIEATAISTLRFSKVAMKLKDSQDDKELLEKMDIQYVAVQSGIAKSLADYIIESLKLYLTDLSWQLVKATLVTTAEALVRRYTGGLGSAIMNGIIKLSGYTNTYDWVMIRTKQLMNELIAKSLVCLTEAALSHSINSMMEKQTIFKTIKTLNFIKNSVELCNRTIDVQSKGWTGNLGQIALIANHARLFINSLRDNTSIADPRINTAFKANIAYNAIDDATSAIASAPMFNGVNVIMSDEQEVMKITPNLYKLYTYDRFFDNVDSGIHHVSKANRILSPDDTIMHKAIQRGINVSDYIRIESTTAVADRGFSIDSLAIFIDDQANGVRINGATGLEASDLIHKHFVENFK